MAGTRLRFGFFLGAVVVVACSGSKFELASSGAAGTAGSATGGASATGGTSPSGGSSGSAGAGTGGSGGGATGGSGGSTTGGSGGTVAGCSPDLQTDAHNCGACGHSCLGGTCLGGLCSAVPLEVGNYHARAIAIDAAAIYWSDGLGNIKRYTKDGASKQDLVSGAPTQRIALDDGFVYYTVDTATTKLVARVAKGGGTPELIAANQNAPLAVAADADDVYWSVGNGVMSLPKSAIGTATPPTLLGSTPSSGGFVALDGTNLYATGYYGGTLAKLPKSGGTSSAVATGQSGPRGLVVDGTNLIFAAQDAGAVREVSVVGGPVTDLATGQAQPYSVFVQGGDAYWTNYAASPGSFGRAALAGGGPSAFVVGGAAAWGIAVDTEAVYVTLEGTTPTNGGLVKMAKPL